MTALPDRRLYLGTDDGLRVLDGRKTRVTATALAGDPVRDVAVDPTDPDTAWIGCALGGWGLHRTDDAGHTVEGVGFDDRWVWGVHRLPDGNLYVGTEPPDLFRHEGNGRLSALDGIHDVAGREDWTFGYEPFEAGHVHGVTAHPDRSERMFAAVEVGGILVSEDGGTTWESRLRGADVHRIAVDPDDPNLVFAATETGVYESHDGGTTWMAAEATDGLYVKSFGIGPGGTLYVAAAGDMGDTDVRVYTREDTWHHTDTVTDASVLAFAAVDGTLLLQQAGETGRLLASGDGGRTWSPVGPSVPRVRCIRSAPL